MYSDIQKMYSDIQENITISYQDNDIYIYSVPLNYSQNMSILNKVLDFVHLYSIITHGYKLFIILLLLSNQWFDLDMYYSFRNLYYHVPAHQI